MNRQFLMHVNSNILWKLSEWKITQTIVAKHSDVSNWIGYQVASILSTVCKDFLWCRAEMWKVKMVLSRNEAPSLTVQLTMFHVQMLLTWLPTGLIKTRTHLNRIGKTKIWSTFAIYIENARRDTICFAHFSSNLTGTFTFSLLDCNAILEDLIFASTRVLRRRTKVETAWANWELDKTPTLLWLFWSEYYWLLWRLLLISYY